MTKNTASGVNFINILYKPFSGKSALRSFSLITVWLCDFWQKTIGSKAARKILMKLNTELISAKFLDVQKKYTELHVHIIAIVCTLLHLFKITLSTHRYKK